MINAKKSQMLYFKRKDKISCHSKPPLPMDNGETITYVEEYIHLGNVISTLIIHTQIVTNAIIIMIYI